MRCSLESSNSPDLNVFPALKDEDFLSGGQTDRSDRLQMRRKLKGLDFIIDRQHNRPAVARHMGVTGG